MKLIFQFFLPILIGNLFQQLYSFVDSMVVGKGIGDTALAAVGNTGSVHFLIIGFAVGLTGGLGICISHSFGANDTKKLRKEIAMSVYICLAIGIVITTFSLLLMRRLFIFLQTPEDMMTDTLVYFGTILAGSTITIFNNFVMTLLRSVGNSKVPLVSMVLSAIANIVLDLLFAPKFLASLMLNDPTVISYTCIFLPLTGIALFPLGWLFVFRNACQGMGKTVLPMISGVVEVVMRVGIVQIAVPHFAFRGVAFAEISAWIGAGAMLMVTYLVYQVRLSKGVSK